MLEYKSVHVWNGKASVRFGLPASCNIGDRIKMCTTVNDVSRVTPFVSEFTIEVGPEAVEGDGQSQSSKSGVLGVPEIKPVFRNEWELYGFNEHTAVVIKHGDEEKLDFFINMDNLHLLNEINKRRNLDPDVIRYWFKYGLFLQSMGMLYHNRRFQNVKGH